MFIKALDDALATGKALDEKAFEKSDRDWKVSWTASDGGLSV